MIIAKKSLGQNFLIDKNIIEKICNAGNLDKNDNVLEIGPGTGNLTEFILKKKPKKFYVIEKDESLVKNIKVFDVYEGENIPENHKSIAISVTIQSSEKTLNEADLEQINNLIIKTVENKTGAKIRS